jgi:putative transposase
MDIQILKGGGQSGSYPSSSELSTEISVSDVVKRLKGRSSRLLLDEFAELKKRYWGSHLWEVGYGAWSIGNLTEEMLQEYLEHHNPRNNDHSDNFILE